VGAVVHRHHLEVAEVLPHLGHDGLGQRGGGVAAEEEHGESGHLSNRN
jgi:hypothetical protein